MMIAERLERRHQAKSYREHRQRYIGQQIEATRRKLAALHREAIDLGMPELVDANTLLENPDFVSDALESEARAAADFSKGE